VCCSVLQCICEKYTSCVILNDDIILQHILCVAVCCSVAVLQCCSMLRCVAVCLYAKSRHRAWFWIAVSSYSTHCVLQCVAVCCSVLHCVAACWHAKSIHRAWFWIAVSFYSTHCVLQCAAVCCSVLQCVAECLVRNGVTPNCAWPVITILQRDLQKRPNSGTKRPTDETLQ